MKTLCFVALLLPGSFVASAQGPHTNFGVKAGLNVANIHIKDGVNTDARASFHIGGLAHIHVSTHFAIQPELLYSGQGAKYSTGNQTASTRLNYITVPILAQYMTGTGFRFETGPQVGALVTAKTEVNDHSTDVKDDYKKIDLSWAFGASYVLPEGLGFDARYNHGMSNINDQSNPKVTNRVFAIGVFYQFGVASASNTR